MKHLCFKPYNEQDINRPELHKAGSFEVVKVKVINEQDINSPELYKAGSFAVVKVKANLLKYSVIKKYWLNIKG